MIDTLEQTPDLNERIVSAYEYDLEQRSNGTPHAFADLRERARGSFEKLGIPTRKHEAWKYTHVEKALRHDYAVLHPGAPSSS